MKSQGRKTVVSDIREYVFRPRFFNALPSRLQPDPFIQDDIHGQLTGAVIETSHGICGQTSNPLMFLHRAMTFIPYNSATSRIQGERPMPRTISNISKRLLWACMTFLAVSFSLSAFADAASNSSPTPGGYCPSKDILLITAEDLSAGVQLAMGSRAALIDGESVMAMSKLTSTGTSLFQAASRGAAARTVLLIDAILQSKVGEDYASMLTWFPLLQASLLTLPQDETVAATSDLVGKSSDLMQSGKGSDALESLKEARHMLACDNLDIPLQAAIQAQKGLLVQFGPDTKSSAYDNLVNSLRSALAYTLGASE